MSKEAKAVPSFSHKTGDLLINSLTPSRFSSKKIQKVTFLFFFTETCSKQHRETKKMLICFHLNGPTLSCNF